MSREKECKCCHEWWYASVIKEDLCPNCYDYFKQLKHQLAEKDKEIERLKNLFELNNEVVINQGKEIFDLRVQVLQQKQNQTQLAIQELEKVKVLIQNAINFVRPNFVEVYDAINKQINELKGEKDEV